LTPLPEYAKISLILEGWLPLLCALQKVLPDCTIPEGCQTRRRAGLRRQLCRLGIGERLTGQRTVLPSFWPVLFCV